MYDRDFGPNVVPPTLHYSRTPSLPSSSMVGPSSFFFFMNPGLYIVGTPIGNLGDISQRALETLRNAHVIFAEDTRRTRKLLSRYDLHTPLISCHGFNEARRVESLLNRIRRGEVVALVTDSGMPGISDPGARLVTACRRAELPITAIPGPSAVTTAVALCGFVDKDFMFEGYLPPKSAARRRRLEALREESRPIVFFESPHRFMKVLNELDEIMPDRELFVGRELTKQYEQLNWGTPAQIRDRYGERKVRGEFVLVLAGARLTRVGTK